MKLLDFEMMTRSGSFEELRGCSNQSYKKSGFEGPWALTEAAYKLRTFAKGNKLHLHPSRHVIKESIIPTLTLAKLCKFQKNKFHLWSNPTSKKNFSKQMRNFITISSIKFVLQKNSHKLQKLIADPP